MSDTVIVIVTSWTTVSVVFAIIIGKTIRNRDRGDD